MSNQETSTEKPAFPVTRNSVYLEDGRIDCEMDHPTYGWIPTTISRDENPDFFDHVVETGAVVEYAPPPPPPHADQRELALARINEVHAEFLRKLTGNASVEERDTWQPKVAGAEFVRSADDAEIEAEIALLNAGHPEALHDLATLVDDVGEDVATIRALADTVLRLSLNYKRLIGKASGLKRRAKDAIMQATDEAVPVEQVGPALEALFAQLSTEADAAVAQWHGQTST